MLCDLKKTDRVSKLKGYPLYVCTRKGCRGHGFDRGRGIPQRMCDQPRLSFRLGSTLQVLLYPIAFVFFVFGMKCNCKQRRDHLDSRFGITLPNFLVKERPMPWDDPLYRDRIV